MLRFLILIALAAAAFFGLQYFMTLTEGLTVAMLILDADMITKLAILLLNFAVFGAIILGLISLADRSGATQSILGVMTWAAPGLALLVAATRVMAIMRGIEMSGGAADVRVWAPAAAEALAPVFFGLTAAAIAALFLLKKPAKSEPAAA